MKVGQMLAEKSLPHQLKLLLANPSILKVGRLVNADLQYLQKGCQSRTAFVGGIDLAKFAKDCQMVSTARASLADLCASVLGKQLDKNTSEQVSSAWENDNLTDKQVQYASKDAYASLCIYEQLIKIPLPRPLPAKPIPGTPVLLFNNDQTHLIAQGSVSVQQCDHSFDGINVTATRAVIEVHKVLVPGAIIGTHRKQSLEDFGTTPFHLVCLRSHLQMVVSSPLSGSSVAPTCEGQSNAGEVRAESSVAFTPSEMESQAADIELDDVGIGALIFDTIDIPLDPTPSVSHPRISDAASEAEGHEMLATESTCSSPPPIHSRVLKDPFHVFNMLYISRSHGLRVEFSQALRDAIFIPDKEDKQHIIAWGSAQNPPRSWDDMLRRNASWLWKHCKRTIPPPEQLHPLVANVFRTYGALKDAKTALPLFNSAAWKTAKNILNLIKDGYLSDPPGIPLYYQIGVDNKAGGLPLFCCIRGTNLTEGGVHTHLHSRLPTSGVSVRHLLASLLDFILRHNLLASCLLYHSFYSLTFIIGWHIQ